MSAAISRRARAEAEVRRLPKRALPTSRKAAIAAARAAAEKQATDVIILEVRELIVITDYFVVASGATERQVRTITDEVERALEGLGSRAVRREGQQDGRWILLDFVDVVVHVFTQTEREYYELERLWKDAPRVPWEEREPTRRTRTRSGPGKAG